MRAYVAAKFCEKERAAAFAQRLRRAGLHTVSGWHEGAYAELEARAIAGDDDAVVAICARNHTDLKRADTLVLLARPDIQGAAVETAVAYVRGCRVVVVGDMRPLSLLMLRLPGIENVPDEDAAVALLGRSV